MSAIHLSDKKILVTGGTSRLGEELVLRFRRAQAKVFFTYHRQEKKAAELSAEGAEGFQLDLSDANAIRKFAGALQKRGETLDVLIHNAAAVRDHTLANLSETDWDEVIAVDLKAPFYLTQQLLPMMRPRERQNPGKIFLMTSRAAFRGGFGITNYAAAKGGMLGLMRGMARELAPEHILVNAVNPGFMESGMTRDLPAEVRKFQRQESLLGRFSEPGEVADFIIFMSSAAMTQVSGQVFHYESRPIWG